MRWFVFLVATATAVTCQCTTAHAQAIPPYRIGGIRQNTTPVYSPYLNLLRGGSFVNNFYGLVQPQLEFRSSILGLQQQTSQIPDVYAAAVAASGLPTTGHGIRFLNTSHYFLNTGGGQQAPATAAAAALNLPQRSTPRGAQPLRR